MSVTNRIFTPKAPIVIQPKSLQDAAPDLYMAAKYLMCFKAVFVEVAALSPVGETLLNVIGDLERAIAKTEGIPS